MKASKVRTLLFGLATLLMLGHSMVPHDHSNPPEFILWKLFSVDLGGDHLQHFAPSSSDVAPEEVNQVQLPSTISPLRVVSIARSSAHHPVGTPCRPFNRLQGHLSSWSRRPPPSSLA